MSKTLNTKTLAESCQKKTRAQELGLQAIKQLLRR